VDIDECYEEQHNCTSKESCMNIHGGYFCHCRGGYRRNPESGNCDDVDECLELFPTPCGQLSDCKNLNGSYTCECSNGYQKLGMLDECVDIDECQNPDDKCPHHTFCVNYPGGYTCKCPDGTVFEPSLGICVQLIDSAENLVY
jgi:hypothetical protein